MVKAVIHLLKHFIGRKQQACSEYGNPHFEQSVNSGLFLRAALMLLFQPVQLRPDLVNIVANLLPERRQVGSG